MSSGLSVRRMRILMRAMQVFIARSMRLEYVLMEVIGEGIVKDRVLVLVRWRDEESGKKSET